MNKIVTLSLLALLMTFSGNVLAHCGNAEAHAVSSKEHTEKDSLDEGDEKKVKKSKNNMTNRY
ncbi:hypothetical protein OAN34_03905 [Hyphomicrobiales bacterium]|nr:hypothetical protein [Hyphomicrobiales bacterium]|tara:strand:+ start:373 stop:561 length:189 start_codon:yes stop_codon:yes gene_type:complete